MKGYWELFRAFFWIGSITFGGGYAVLPILLREIVEKRKWLTEDEMLDYFAVSQITPGDYLRQCFDTFLGYRLKGFWGALIATLGVIMPSLIIITVIAAVLSNFADIVWVQHAFAGIRIAVSALIASTVWKLFRKNVNSWLKAAIAVLAFATAVGILQYFADIRLHRVCGVRRVLLRKEASGMIYLQLAFEFFKAGMFAVGGGLATLPFLMQMSYTYPGWFSIDELMQMVAISRIHTGPYRRKHGKLCRLPRGGHPRRGHGDALACAPRVSDDHLIVVRVLGPFPNQPPDYGRHGSAAPRRYRD